MALDPSRAALVTQEYRYAVQSDAGIKAIFPDAREIILETNLDASGGSALALATFNATSTHAYSFSFDIEDVLFSEDFIGAPNRYSLSFDRHPAAGSNTYTLIGAKVDYWNGITTLTVRGS